MDTLEGHQSRRLALRVLTRDHTYHVHYPNWAMFQHDFFRDLVIVFAKLESVLLGVPKSERKGRTL